MHRSYRDFPLSEHMILSNEALLPTKHSWMTCSAINLRRSPHFQKAIELLKAECNPEEPYIEVSFCDIC